MEVRALMSRDVVTVSPKEPATVAARMLARYNIGALPVAENGRLRGMITDRDIAVRCVAAGRDPGQTPVEEIMTGRVVSAAPGDDAEEAARCMAREQIRRLPVVERGCVVGMLSLGDLSVNDRMKMEASACLSEISSNVKHR